MNLRKSSRCVFSVQLNSHFLVAFCATSSSQSFVSLCGFVTRFRPVPHFGRLSRNWSEQIFQFDAERICELSEHGYARVAALHKLPRRLAGDLWRIPHLQTQVVKRQTRFLESVLHVCHRYVFVLCCHSSSILYIYTTVNRAERIKIPKNIQSALDAVV